MKRGINMFKSKRSQIMGLPFSVIFSIILIVVFIIVAIIAIKMFWNPAGCGFSENAQEASFMQDLQDRVNEVWNADKAETNFKINLPGQISHVCLLDYNAVEKNSKIASKDELTLFGVGNLYLYPGKKACTGFRSIEIKHINITIITKQENPYCIENKKEIKLSKGFYDSLVKIS